MDRFRLLDIDVTCLEGLSSKPSSFPFALQDKVLRCRLSRPRPLPWSPARKPHSLTLSATRHAWKNSPPRRFNAEVSNFHDNCSMLMIQLRKRRPFHADKDVGEPLIVPVIELFESAEYGKASLSNAAVYGIEYYAYDDKDFRKKRQVYLYFSYKFSNSTSPVGREVHNDAGGGSGSMAIGFQGRTEVQGHTPTFLFT